MTPDMPPKRFPASSAAASHDEPNGADEMADANEDSDDAPATAGWHDRPRRSSADAFHDDDPMMCWSTSTRKSQCMSPG